MRAYRHPHSSRIPWRLLLSHNITPRHAPEPIACCNSRRDGDSFPLTNDVIGHERVQRCPVGDVCAGCEEGSDIADCDLGGEAEHEKTGDEAEGVEGDERAADTEGIPDEGGEEDGDDGPVVWLLGLVSKFYRWCLGEMEYTGVERIMDALLENPIPDCRIIGRK